MLNDCLLLSLSENFDSGWKYKRVTFNRLLPPKILGGNYGNLVLCWELTERGESAVFGMFVCGLAFERTPQQGRLHVRPEEAVSHPEGDQKDEEAIKIKRKIDPLPLFTHTQTHTHSSRATSATTTTPWPIPASLPPPSLYPIWLAPARSPGLRVVESSVAAVANNDPPTHPFTHPQSHMYTHTC